MRTPLLATSSVVLASLVSLSLACSSNSNDGTTPADAGTVVADSGATDGATDGGATDGATGPGIPIPAGAVVTLKGEGGGLVPQPAAGSTCRPVDATYTFDTSSGAFTSEVCTPNDAGVASIVTRSATLDAPTSAPIRAALANVQVATSAGCEADATIDTLVVTASGIATDYVDDGACGSDAGIGVSGLDALAAAFASALD